jgi:hypothetical protein
MTEQRCRAVLEVQAGVPVTEAAERLSSAALRTRVRHSGPAQPGVRLVRTLVMPVPEGRDLRVDPA